MRKIIERKQNKGFTLIELLIVIVIIGILAGVLITVIEPGKQQSRAGDATIKSMLNKVVLSTEGFISAYGRAPNESEFFYSLETNTSQYGGNSCEVGGSPDYECLFQVNGIPSADTCGPSSYWTGSETEGNDCYFRYYSGSNLPENTGTGGRQFRVYVKSLGSIDSIFVYDNLEGGQVYMCPVTEIDDSTRLDSTIGCTAD